MKDYINQKGKRIVIREMANPYLLNSYSFYKARLETIDSKLLGNPNISKYKKRLQQQVNFLWLEIKKRKLIQEPAT